MKSCIQRILFVLPLAALCLPAAAADKPNILWLIAEDNSPDSWSCYGDYPEVHTPNVDKMASEGVRFTRAYTCAPVCSASRSGFMTGMYQTTIGAQNHRSHRDDGYKVPEGVKPLTDWMRDNGYYTVNVRETPAGFGFKGSGKTDWNFTYNAKTTFDSDKWSDLKAHQPFYGQINFHETHRKFTSPKKADPAKVEIPPYYPDHPVTRKDWAEYLDAAMECDEHIGHILAQLKEEGMLENTVILFFGDHGEAHVRGKQFVYEEGLSIPLIVRWPKNFPAPKHVKPGLVDTRLIEAIDFAPTMLDIIGAKKPEKMQGHIMFGDRADPDRQYAFGARDRCDETVFRLRSVRDDRYRYIHNFTPERPFLQKNNYKETSYPVWNLLKKLDKEGKLTEPQKFLTAPHMPEEELYDLKNDRWEIHNLATSTDPENQAALKRLRGVLDKWIEDTNDQGRTFEPPEVAAAQGSTKKAAGLPSDKPAKKGKKKAEE